MKSRQFQTLLAICQRIHEETLKALPYSSNRHPVHGYMSESDYSHAHNVMRAAAQCCKKVTIDMVVDDVTKTMPVKHFVLNYMNIDISRFPKDENDESIMDELNERVLTLTDCNVMLYQLEKKLKEQTTWDKTYPSEKHSFESRAKNAKRFGVGNCSDRARYNIVAAMECPVDANALTEVLANSEGLSIEYFVLNGGFDHAFTVVNRDLNSDPKDPSTWGEHAIVIDSWWNMHNEGKQGVFVVQEEVAKHERGEASSLFDYILDATGQGYLSNCDDPAYYFAEGHTPEWKQKAAIGKVPTFFCDYSDLKQKQEQECEVISLRL